MPADRFMVQVTAARQSWISAIVDGSRAAQREFKPGEEVSFEHIGKRGECAFQRGGTDSFLPDCRPHQQRGVRQLPGGLVTQPTSKRISSHHDRQPLVEFFKRGEVARDVRLLAAQGGFAPRAHEQLSILVLLVEDPDPEVRQTADATLNRLPVEALSRFLSRPDVSVTLRDFFAARGVAVVAGAPAEDAEAPLVDVDVAEPGDEDLLAEGDTDQLSVSQKIAKMTFTQRLKAASKGTREMRAILVRDRTR